MKKLSEALPTTSNTAETWDRSSDSLNMPAHGSTIEAGKMITPSARSNPTTQGEAGNSKRPLYEECYEQKTQISNCPEQKQKLTKLVMACFESMNTYGGGGSAMESSVMLMQMTLGRFNYDVVRGAFEVYMQSNRDMPKPADIVQIIEPKKQSKKFCKVAFLDIKRQQREGAFVTAAEKQYIADFMDAAVNGEPDERAELQAIADDGARQDKQYWVEN